MKKLLPVLILLGVSFSISAQEHSGRFANRWTDAGPRPVFEQAANPGNLPDIGWIFTKETAGKTELFYEDDAGSTTQITSNGAVSAAAINGSLDLTGDILTEQVLEPVAPTAALISPASPGNVDIGDHDYAITYVTLLGETLGGAASGSVTVVDNAVNGKIRLTAIPTSANQSVTSRKLYRRFNGAGDYKLVTTIADNTTTAYTDNTANAGLGSSAPSINSTASVIVGGSVSITTAGVKLSSSSAGTLTLLGLGGGDTEDITVDLAGVADGATITSSTGLISINFDLISLQESGIGVLNADEIDASSELAAIMDDETGTGVLVFGTSPTITTSITQDGDAADSGFLRLINAESIAWETSPAGTDISLSVGADEIMQCSGSFNAAGTITSAATGNLGWSYVDGTDNTSCEAQCTNAAVFGVDKALATGDVIVGPTDATADACICAGAN